jgi:hypothetical protein
MDMIVAGGGERDEAVDATILSGLLKAERPEAFLNERLMSDLRPTLFLAQLSNLLAGNISIVHGVTGSSRTFMGEEAAGVDAVRVAHARIGAGQSKIALVGGAYNAEHLEVVLHNAMGNALWKGEPKGVWERAALGGGMALGSIGAFLVLEERITRRRAAQNRSRAFAPCTPSGCDAGAGRSRPSSNGCGPRSRRRVRSQSSRVPPAASPRLRRSAPSLSAIRTLRCGRPVPISAMG